MSTELIAPPNAGVISKTEFLTKFPWDAEWTKYGSPVDDLWVFEYDFTPEEVWPVIADTSTLNRRLELPAMTFEEQDGRLFGSATYAGIFSEWEEIPWEWEYLRYLESVRIYSRGIARYVRGVFMLEPLEGGRCRYYVYFGWIPTGPITRLMLRIGLGRLRDRYGRTIRTLLEESRAAQAAQSSATESARLAQMQFPATKIEINEARWKASRAALLAAGQPEDLVDRVMQYIATAPDDVLYRIRVRGLAREWGVDEKQLLLLFLHGTRSGLFYLTWDVVCPHCRGVRSEVNHLGELPARDECEVCDIDFDTQGVNSFEVTFHVHGSVREVEKQYFCSAEPAKKNHIKLQLSLRPGEKRSLDTALATGAYRMRTQGERIYHPLELDPAYGPTPVDWTAPLARDSILKTAPRPPVLLANPDDEPKIFIIEENVEDRDVLRPVDLFNFQDFRDLFSREALAADIQLDVGLQTILFTDIVGSSRYYQTRGDQGAFAEVRKHFVEIYRIVKNRNGAVVKTIGDAAMAAFSRPADAVFAAIELQRYYGPENTNADLRLRVSIHQGPCLAVNLNSNIDYFGNTVNLAAKLQALVEAGQVAFSERVLADPETRRYFSENKIPLTRLHYAQPWDQQKLEVYRFNVSANTAKS